MSIDPPAITRSAAVRAQLDAAYGSRGPTYRPRTHLRTADGGARYVNRLIGEASPYLVQHAHNPVDWRPWGEEAFAEAKARDCPVLLSVGYATCHWCHVMEEESFDNEEVAEAINLGFVAVKLDREQRPDLDQVYITATQLQQGHAGWPNTLFLRPDALPFHTGTYFPPHAFLQVLSAVRHAWDAKRPEVDEVADRMASAIRRAQAAGARVGALPDAAVAAACTAHLGRIHNDAQGGFSADQQFPQEVFVLFLLDRWRRDGDDEALSIAARTLDAIAAGGIHDHAGGGFHRYTVDVTWRTPHFEKMLYNQGLLARAFIEGWEATGRPAWRRAAERCFAYLARDMTDEAGAFYAAEDADSLSEDGRREEGAFYLWTADQARAVLGDDAAWAIAALGLEKPIGEVGPVAHLEPGAPVMTQRLDPILERLRAAREARPRPIRDEKVIAGWNGLAIRALAEGALAFGAPRYGEMAARAGDALWERLWDGRALWRLWADGRAMEPALLEDHAWLGLGYLALHEATGDGEWLRRAALLAGAVVERFGDADGRLRMAEEAGPLGPIHESSDGATPAGESSALELLVRVAEATGDAALKVRAQEAAAALSGVLRDMPVLRPQALVAARQLADGPSGARRLLADGALLVHLARHEGALRLDMRIAEGWHLNAADAGAAGLEGAAAVGARAAWPPGEPLDVAFADAPIPVYRGALSVPIAPCAETEADMLTLTLQLCSDRSCQAPLRVGFRLGGEGAA